MAKGLKIRQVRGLAGKPWRHKLIVRDTLGLRRIGHEVCRQDLPSVRCAIRHVAELVEVIGDCDPIVHA